MTTLKTIHELTELAEVPEIDDEVALYDATTGATRRNSRKNFLGYTEYVALLTQSGTNAPTATVVKNDTGATAVWSRIAQGAYMGTFSSSVLTANKTVVISQNNNDSCYNLTAAVGSTTLVVMVTRDNNHAATDGLLVNTAIVIRIYI